MQGITSGRVQVLGISVAVPPAARLPEPWTFSWSSGTRTWAGSGVSAALRAPDHVELLESVARAEVVTEGGDARPPAPWFGGFAFDATAPAGRWWEAFPPAWALLPQLLLGSDGRTAELFAFARIGEGGLAAARERALGTLTWAQARLEERPIAGEPPRPPHIRPQDRSGWDTLVSGSLAAFESGVLKKVVLARAIELEADAPFAVPLVRERMRAIAGPAVGYELRAEDGTTLLGASPERLFTLEAGRLETQALASSAAPGELDRLTGGRKEAREHSAVVESIRSRSRSDTSPTSTRPSAHASGPASLPPTSSARCIPPLRSAGHRERRRWLSSALTSASPGDGTPGPSAGSGRIGPTSASPFAAPSSAATRLVSSRAPAACPDRPPRASGPRPR
jgi:isochorismate synthase EntC